MSTLLEVNAEPGLSVNLFCGLGSQWLKVSGGLEAYNPSDLASYAAPGAESGGAGTTGLYTASTGTPSAVGWYWVFWSIGYDFTQKFGRERLYWDGTSWASSSPHVIADSGTISTVTNAVVLPTTPPAGYGGSTDASDFTGAFSASVLANTPAGSVSLTPEDIAAIGDAVAGTTVIDTILGRVELITAATSINLVSTIQTGGTLHFVAGADYPVSLSKGLRIACPAPTSGESVATLEIADANTNDTLFAASGEFIEAAGLWYAEFNITANDSAALVRPALYKMQWCLIEITSGDLKLPIYVGGRCAISSVTGPVA